jgi:hypothetical protein
LVSSPSSFTSKPNLRLNAMLSGTPLFICLEESVDR